MDQYAMLWAYQAEDMKADRLEDEIHRSPLRQKMDADRKLYRERQEQYKQITEQVAMLADRKDAIRDAITRCEDQLRQLQARFESNPPADADAARALFAEVRKCRDTIAGYEQEMTNIINRVNAYNKKGNAISQEGLTIRTEFEKLKAQYEAEMPAKKAALEAQRAQAARKAESVPPALLEQYRQLKRRITPPVALLNNDQCSGCNMALPSAVLRRIRSASNEVVCCESCGRMLIKL